MAMLVMPLITEAGLLSAGGGFGRGALRINDTTVDYYSATKGSFGLQIGGQQFSHVLFFMTEDSLDASSAALPAGLPGADVEYVFKDEGENLRAETTTSDLTGSGSDLWPGGPDGRGLAGRREIHPHHPLIAALHQAGRKNLPAEGRPDRHWPAFSGTDHFAISASRAVLQRFRAIKIGCPLDIGTHDAPERVVLP